MKLPLAPRLAWRSLRRHRLRSVLVMALLGLVCGAATYGMVASESMIPSHDERIRLTVGDAHTVLMRAQNLGAESDAAPPVVPASITARQIPIHTLYVCSQSIEPVAVQEFATRGRVRSGVLPAHPDEVALGVASCPELPLGSMVNAGGEMRRLVGRVTDLNRQGRQDASVVLVDPDPLLARARKGSGHWMLTGPALTAEQARAIDQQGWRVIPRDDVSGVVPMGGTAKGSVIYNSYVLGVSALVMIFVTTLTAALMSVGVGEQRREAALLRVTGARRSTLGAMVRWSALWLALCGALAGAAAGLGLASWQILGSVGGYSTTFYGLHIVWWQVLLVMAVTVASAVVAAYLPALRIASDDAWVGVRRVDAPSPALGYPYGGTLLVIVAVVALGLLVVFDRAQAGDGAFTPSTPTFYTLTLLPAIIGLWLSLGWILQRLATVHWPWVSLRLVARTSSRHVARAVPMVMALALIWALVVGVMTTAAPDGQAPPQGGVGRGQLSIQRDKEHGVDDDLATITSALGRAPRSVAQGQLLEAAARIDGKQYCGESSWCRDGMLWQVGAYGVILGGPEFLAPMLGREPTEAERADFAAGKVFAWGKGVVRDGTVEMRWGEEVLGRLPAVEASRQGPELFGGILVPTSHAKFFDRVTRSHYVLLSFDGVSDGDLAKVGGVVANVKAYPYAHGLHFLTPWTIATLVLVLLVSLLTWLALADARRDDATLAEVGASPRLRKRLAVATAAYLSTLGFGCGAVLGFIWSMAPRIAHSSAVAITPWPVLTWLVVLAASCAVAWLVTPKRPYRRPRSRRLS